MNSSLSSLDDILSHTNECKEGNAVLDMKESKTKNYSLTVQTVIKRYEYKFDEDFKKRFATQMIFEMLQKGNYPYHYMDNWERFNEIQLPSREEFYYSLNLEQTSDAGYKTTERVWKDFEINNLGKNHDLYVQSYTFLLVDVFQQFRSKHLEIYEIDSAHFL